VEKDLYTIHLADGSRDLHLEHGLHELENRFAQIRDKKLNKRERLSPGDRAFLCAFVAAAHFRTPRVRDHWASQWGGLLQKFDRFAENAKSATAEQRRAMTGVSRSGSSKGSFTREHLTQLAERPLQTMLAPYVSQLTPLLVKMSIEVQFTDDPIGFITTDAPCTFFDPQGYKRPPFYRDGLGSETTEVTLPISPSKCLLFNWRGLDGYREAPDWWVHELNRRHIAHCDEYFISRSPTTNPYWFQILEPPDDAWEKKHPVSDGDDNSGS
jgi:hypothetical protein